MFFKPGSTYEIKLFSEEEIILIWEINVGNYFVRLSVLIACVPTKLSYKCQMFLWWRLFSRFADSLKVLGGGIHFKLIESFLVVDRRRYKCSFSLHKLINRCFSRESHYKIFSVHLFNKSKLPLEFRRSRRHSPPQVMRSFFRFSSL